MRQSKFAGGKNAYKIEIEQIAKLLDREIVDRPMRRMPAGIVYQTIDPAIFFNRLIDQILDLVRVWKHRI